jgi:hypothetical protein
MKPFTTLKRNDKVVIWRNTHSQLSTVEKQDIGKVFTISGVEYDGRRHNKYISYVYLIGRKHREVRATVDELAQCNPNFEPEGEYIVCVGCGATMPEDNLKIIKQLDNVQACPSCGILEPTFS